MTAHADWLAPDWRIDGVGALKVSELERYEPPAALALMRTLKRALDPDGLMNPGKVLRVD